MSQIRIEYTNTPNPDWENTVKQGLYAHNRKSVGSRDLVSFSLFALNEQDEVVGGLLGDSIWGWLMIDILWVSETVRGQGYGEKLMMRAEEIAIEKGYTNIILETFSFQALPFYQKLGYVVYGQLDGFPPGHTRYSLKKALAVSDAVKDNRPPTYHESLRYYSKPDKTSTGEYLTVLYEIILGLLNRHSKDELLTQIVEDAATFLDAPYGEIMLLEGDTLVVRAYTANQPYLLGDTVKRGEALVTWRAFDTKQPVLVDDYFKWSGKRVLYDDAQLRAVGDFPILLGDKCIGVLAMARVEPDYPFSENDVQRGMQFAQLIAVVIDNVELYQQALEEIEERKQSQAIIEFQNETLRQTNLALEEARKQADEANAVKGKFVATMSHEIRTPLNAIMGYTQLYLEGLLGDLSDEQQEFMRRIFANSKQLLYLINQVLDFSKMGAGFTEIIPSDFSIAALVNDIFTETESLAIRKGLIYQLELDKNMPLRAFGDWGRMKQVITNFISNAIKFTDKGQVTLSCGRVDDETWYVRVSDTGIGIPQDQLNSIFEEFQQTVSGQQRGGTGLGLAIVKKLVTLMGGTITVTSQIGTGSQFTVSLPFAYEGKSKA
ncbi:MAG: GNAT family N-acetyltransferase [bacterium]|nr:GNAT family N-acetyltransferase [bacterium]